MKLTRVFTLALVAALALTVGFLPLAPASIASAQMEASGDKFVAYGTATADNADATIAAPTGGNHLVLYGINATCATAAAMTITVVEDTADDADVLLTVVTASTTNHTITFGDTGLIVTSAENLRIRLGTCGGGIVGHVTAWGQQER